MLNPKNNLEQTVTLYEFVALWCSESNLDLSNISNRRKSEYHHSSLASYYLPTPPEILEEEEKLMETYNIVRTSRREDIITKPPLDSDRVKTFEEELIEQLLHDEKFEDFPDRQNIVPTYTHNYMEHLAGSFSDKKEFIVDFYSYKLCKLIDYSFNYDIPPEKIPDWVKQYRNPVELPTGFLEIEKLPKLIQLAISGFKHFDWDNIKPNTPKDKYRTQAVNYLNAEAKKLSINHLFDKHDKLSSKLTDQLIRIIDPNNDSENK